MLPLIKHNYHNNIVDDISFNNNTNNLLGSICNDGNLIIFDIRTNDININFKCDNICGTSLDFNKFND